MKVRFLLLCFCFLSITANKLPTAASLENVIEDLSSIARLTNGIAIQTGLSKDSSKINDIIAEFLDVESGDLIAKLKSLEVEKLSENLKAFNKKFESFPGFKVKDVSALREGLSRLEDMKKDVETLKKKVVDSSADLKNRTDVGRRVPLVSLYDVSKFAFAIEKLKYIRENHYETIPEGSFKSDFVAPLKDAFDKIAFQLDSFKRYEQLKTPVYLHDIDKELEDFKSLVIASRPFFKNAGSFETISSELDALKNDVLNFKSVLDSGDVLTKFSSTLNATAEHVSLLRTSRTLEKHLTLGFSSDVDGLQLLQKDLNEKKLAMLVAEGKDLKSLGETLNTVLALYEPIQQLDNVWKTFFNGNDSLDTVNHVLSDASKWIVPIEEVSRMQDGLKTVGDCVKKLKPLTAPPDLSDADKLINFASEVSEQIRKFMKVMKEVTALSDYDIQERRAQVLMDELDTELQNQEDMEEETWNRWQNETEIEKLLVILDTIYTKMIGFKKESPFISVKKKVNFDVIPAVLTSLADVNLVETLDCLQKSDSGEIYKLVSLGNSVQVVKDEITSFVSAEKTLLALAEVKRKVLGVEKAVPKNQKTSRRRRASRSLENLKNAAVVSRDLGRGVQVLRELAKILKNEPSVKVAVEADDGLKNAISAIPGAQKVWTTENRNAMGNMLLDLKELDKYSGTVKTDNMSSLWTIFDEAQIIGVTGVDAKVFEDPISIVLNASSNPKIKGVAGDFKILGSLDLNFTQHNSYLVAASYTLQPLQQFFDYYFGDTETPKSVTASKRSPTGEPSFVFTPLISLVILGFIIVIGALLSVGYLVWLSFDIKKKRNTRGDI